MSRIINIGDFYRNQTSFLSVIGSLGTPKTISDYLYGVNIINSPEISGTTGPINVLAHDYPPNVGLYAVFELTTGSNGPYLITATGNATGDATGGFYFDIATPIPADMRSAYCSIYENGEYNGTEIFIATGSSGDTTFFTVPRQISIENSIIMYQNVIANSGTFSLGSVTTTPTGYIVFTIETLDRNYAGHADVIESTSGNPISTANAHAKRQFGNHPRIQSRRR